MDIYCPKCGEPWDLDSLHEEADLQGAPSFRDLPEEARRWAGRDHDPNADPRYLEYRREYDRIFSRIREDFQVRGCQALHEMRGDHAPCKPRDNARAETAAVLYSILGDDLDGAAAMLDDAEALGMFRA